MKKILAVLVPISWAVTIFWSLHLNALNTIAIVQGKPMTISWDLIILIMINAFITVYLLAKE